MNYVLPSIVFIVVTAVSFLLGQVISRRKTSKIIDKTEEERGKILSRAEHKAETMIKEAKLEAKEKFFTMKSDFEKQTKDRREELQAMEKRFHQKEENIDRKLCLLEQKDHNLHKRKNDLDRRQRKLENKEKEVDRILKEHQTTLERISSLTAQDAKKMLMDSMEEEARRDVAVSIKRIIDRASDESDKKAKEIISQAIQRCASEHVVETTVSVVDLPNDEMKGRIIGREGRNIRALEIATGIDLIIDDTPEAVILSGFDAIRREIAAISLRRLVADGRIHPARIEEIVKKVEKEMESNIKELGEQAVFEVGIQGLHPDAVKLLGRLRYRTSYAQNVLHHSIEVAFLSGIMADELGVDSPVARRAGLLHDIGKAMDHEVEGSHAKIGADLARKFNESPAVIEAIACHHGEKQPHSIEAVLVQAADALSAARPGARREILETYIKRLEKLESLADSFKGVDKSYAIQAGREIRIIVKPDEINDPEMSVLAKDIANKIEDDLEYPGEVRVTCIRETRTVEYAK